MNKTVLVMPGTKWQIPLVKKLKARGFRVIVLDLYENQPAYAFADGYRQVDILNLEQCLDVARELEPCAVISDECDIAVPTVAKIAEQLGLKSVGVQQAELYTNKYKMRLFAKSIGAASPEFYKCSSVDEAMKVFRAFGKKMILKPLDANSSRGVFSVHSSEDIVAYFDAAAAFSKHEKSVLLEEYIDGTEFTVDGLKCQGGYIPLAISEKRHFSHNENIARTLLFTHSNSNFDYDLLRKTTADFVERSGLEFGLTHAEYKFRDGKYYLIEIGARGGGNYISSVIVPFLSGIDTQEQLIDWAVGESKKRMPSPTKGGEERCAVLDFFDSKGQSGVVRAIEGTELLTSNPAIRSYDFLIREGDCVETARDDSKRIGYYIACCEQNSELEKTIHDIRDGVKICVNGEAQ